MEEDLKEFTVPDVVRAKLFSIKQGIIEAEALFVETQKTFLAGALSVPENEAYRDKNFTLTEDMSKIVEVKPEDVPQPVA